MAKDGFKVFDSDMHVMEPPDLWDLPFPSLPVARRIFLAGGILERHPEMCL